MSWSHYATGPALEVARKIELEANGPQSYLEPKEKSLHARAVALIIVSCHEQPAEGWVDVKAFGHGEPSEQNVSVTIQAVAPQPKEEVRTTMPVEPMIPVAETPLQEPKEESLAERVKPNRKSAKLK